MKKRLLHIITLSEWGGAQQVCYDIVTNLDNSKYVAEVACAPGGKLVSKLKEQKVTVHTIDCLKRDIAPLKDLEALIRLYQLIRKGRYNVIHCHSTKAGILGRFAGWAARTAKIYFTVHGWGFYNVGEYGRIYSLLVNLEKLAAKVTDKMICVSENDKIEGLKREIGPEDKFKVIHNGISWKDSNPKSLRKKINAKESDIVFLMVARLAYQKNPLLFLKSAKKVVKNHQQVKFVLIGDGPLYSKCEQFIIANQLEKHATLLGFREDVRELLPDADVFVLSSRFEGLPLTIIEAMFAGLPIIATEVGGTDELVQNGINGFLTRPNNIEDLSKKMSYLIKNPQELNNMGKKSRKIAYNNFTINEMIQQYEKLYAE